MSDLISRQAAIDAVETKIKKWNAVDGEGYHVGLGLRYTDVIDTLTELPSAQPEYTEQDMRNEFSAGYDCGMEAARHEIVRCKDCKYGQAHNPDGSIICEHWDDNAVSDDDFCSYAERREE